MLTIFALVGLCVMLVLNAAIWYDGDALPLVYQEYFERFNPDINDYSQVFEKNALDAWYNKYFEEFIKEFVNDPNYYDDSLQPSENNPNTQANQQFKFNKPCYNCA